MVTAITYMEEYSLMFTASQDGTLAAWNISKENNFEIKWFVCDHDESITTIDCNYDLDLIGTASEDHTISLRVVTTHKFVRKIQVDFDATMYSITLGGWIYGWVGG